MDMAGPGNRQLALRAAVSNPAMLQRCAQKHLQRCQLLRA
jgi:hypothetical protein